MIPRLLSWLGRGSAEPEQVPSDLALIDASRAYDGFVREAAVRRLADFESAAALRAIIARLNDWVPQVRVAARASLQSFKRTECLPALIECLDDILSLERKTRADQRETLVALTTQLATREGPPLVEQRFATSDAHVARFLFRMLASGVTGSDDRFLLLAVAHRDVSVRTLAVSALRDFADEGANRMLAGLLRDPHSKVRGEALSELWKRAPKSQERSALLRTGLLDTSESVRALSRLLAQRNGTDVRELLTAWLRDAALRAKTRSAFLAKSPGSAM
jgi:HEAT repeat protein